MKKFVVTSLAAAAGLSMISGAAFAQTGHVGLNYARADFGGGDSDAVGIDGGVTLKTGGGWDVLLDASYADSDGGDSLDGTAHLVTRNANNAWGGWVGLVSGDGSDAFGVGGEWAAFMGNNTLALGLGYGNVDDVDVDIFAGSAEYRIFTTDNMRWDLGATIGRADATGGDATVYGFGGGLEYRFDNSPFSIGGNVTYVNVDDTNVDGTVIGITGRWNFGDSSLKQRDREGNTFGRLGGIGSAVSIF